MRLLIRGVAAACALSALCALPVAAADADPCRKEILVYVDISGTMNGEVGGRRPLTAFGKAVRNLITSPDFVTDSDIVRVMIFADQVHEVTTAASGREEAAAILNRLSDPNEYNALITPYLLEPHLLMTAMTDFNRVLDDMDQKLTDDKWQYVILASDFLHDPENKERDVQGFAAWRQQVEALADRICAYRLPNDGARLRVIPLLPASVPSLPRTECPRARSTDRAELSAVVVAAIEKKFESEHRVVTGDRADVKELKTALAKAPHFEPVFEVSQAIGQIRVEAKNENPFPVIWKGVRLLSGTQLVKSDAEAISLRCGETKLKTLLLPSDNTTKVSVEATFDPPVNPARRDVSLGSLDIEELEIHAFEELFGPGTLVLTAKVKNRLRDASELIVTVGRGTTYRFPIEASSEAQQFIFPVVPLGVDADLVDARGRVPVHVKLGKGELLQNGRPSDGNFQAPSPHSLLKFLMIIIAAATGAASLQQLFRWMQRLAQGQGSSSHLLGFILFLVVLLVILLSDITLTERLPEWMSKGYLWFWGGVSGVMTFFILRQLLTWSWYLIEWQALREHEVVVRRRKFLMFILVTGTLCSTVLVPLRLNALLDKGEVRAGVRVQRPANP